MSKNRRNKNQTPEQKTVVADSGVSASAVVPGPEAKVAPRQFAKFNVLADGDEIVYYCPGCDDVHIIPVKNRDVIWNYNNDVNAPTLSPSIKATMGKGICHHFVRNGEIQYLGDCTHAMKGTNVQLEPFCFSEWLKGTDENEPAAAAPVSPQPTLASSSIPAETNSGSSVPSVAAEATNSGAQQAPKDLSFSEPKDCVPMTAEWQHVTKALPKVDVIVDAGTVSADAKEVQGVCEVKWNGKEWVHIASGHTIAAAPERGVWKYKAGVQQPHLATHGKDLFGNPMKKPFGMFAQAHNVRII